MVLYVLCTILRTVHLFSHLKLKQPKEMGTIITPILQVEKLSFVLSTLHVSGPRDQMDLYDRQREASRPGRQVPCSVCFHHAPFTSVISNPRNNSGHVWQWQSDNWVPLRARTTPLPDRSVESFGVLLLTKWLPNCSPALPENLSASEIP